MPADPLNQGAPAGAGASLAPVMRPVSELPPAWIRLEIARSRLANRRSPPAHRQMPRSKADDLTATDGAKKSLPHSIPGLVSFVFGLISFVAMLGVIGYFIMNLTAAISDHATAHRESSLEWAVFLLLLIQFVAFWLGLAYLAVPGERKIFNWLGMSFFWVSLALLFLLRMPPVF